MNRKLIRTTLAEVKRQSPRSSAAQRAFEWEFPRLKREGREQRAPQQHAPVQVKKEFRLPTKPTRRSFITRNRSTLTR